MSAGADRIPEHAQERTRQASRVSSVEGGSATVLHERPMGSSGRPLRAGRRVSLWPLRQSNCYALARSLDDQEVRELWRTRGRYWVVEQFEARVARDAAAAAVGVVGREADGELVGLCELLDPDLLDQRAHLSVLTTPRFVGTGLGIEMALLFLEFVFAAFPLQKIALEVNSDNWRVVRGLRRVARYEGRLTRHLNINGVWHDVDLFAVFKDDMQRLQRIAGVDRNAEVSRG